MRTVFVCLNVRERLFQEANCEKKIICFLVATSRGFGRAHNWQVTTFDE
jgi:hypothetical protein